MWNDVQESQAKQSDSIVTSYFCLKSYMYLYTSLGGGGEREGRREGERGAIIEKLSGLPIPASLPTSSLHLHSASWDLLPNKLLAAKSLSQALLLGESKLKTPVSHFHHFCCPGCC